MKDRIIVRNARQHNLKGIDLELPRRSLIVVTGPSGSGKSSLAFDTIYAEGQRRYVESLSTYAKQFLERMEKPHVDSVQGISPAVAIEQRNPTKTSRSTVGTATEVYDYLRLLWARAGRTYCPECGEEVRPDTVQSATDDVLALGDGARVVIAFPLPAAVSGRHDRIVEGLRALGFVRVLVDGQILDVSEPDADSPAGLGMDLGEAPEVLVVVDRVVVGPDARERLADALGTAFVEGEGEAAAIVFDREAGIAASPAGGGSAPSTGTRSGKTGGRKRGEAAASAGAVNAGERASGDVAPGQLRFTQRFRCPRHPDVRFLEPTPRLFSFNNPYGSCPVCTGFGATLEYDPALIVPNPAKSLADGAVDPWEKPRYRAWRAKLLAFARARGVSVHVPWQDLPESFRHDVLYGVRGFTGVLPFLRSRETKRYKQYIRVFLRQYQSSQTCRACGGARLRPEALRVRVAGRTIGDVADLAIQDALAWVEALLAGDVARLAAAAPSTERGSAAPASTPGDGPPPTIQLRGRAGQRDTRFGTTPPAEPPGTSPAPTPHPTDASPPPSDRAAASPPDPLASSPPLPDPPLSPAEREIAEPILREIAARLRFLSDVGLGYLSLSRQTRTLSGGEAQRIALSNALGARLVDTLYVLDEPTIGLHPRDTDRLLALLQKLRDGGNTVLVVEHDPAAIRAADHVVELGPGSGERGGRVVFQGSPAELERADTATGRFLAGTDGPAHAPRRRPVDREWLRIEGARLHNVRDVDVEIPLNTLTVVTGVSGSGKSTLVHDILYRNLERELEGETSAKLHLGEEVGTCRRIHGARRIEAVSLIDQSPIGKTPRSNPVTYVKAFDPIRQLFARQPLARQRGYGPGHFSFNVPGGRCEECQGAGVVQVEMVFMADVFVPCDTCGGARYKRDTLDVAYKGLNIRQVLDLTIDEAIRFFIKEDRLGQMLWQVQQVGLGYLRLGQPAPTLSGGEAQRLKIARELASAGQKRGRRLYILDEPTTGLAGGEVRTLLRVLDRLVDAGHTVLVVEHNLDVIRAADWVIDMGPEAGDAGGRIVAAGRPEAIAANPDSHTGRYLRESLGAGAAAAP